MVEFTDNALTSQISLIVLDRGDTLRVNFSLLDTTGKKFRYSDTGPFPDIKFIVEETNISIPLTHDTTLQCFTFNLDPAHTQYLELGEYAYKVVVTTNNLHQTVCRGYFILR